MTQGTRSPIIELRQYTLLPGKRDVLIEIFERQFITAQEDAGMNIIGQFRDLEDLNRFVWLRSFRDMPARSWALGAFYSSDVWMQNRDAVNETLIKWDDVLLLRPVLPQSGFMVGERPAPGNADDDRQGLVAAAIYCLNEPAGADLIELVQNQLEPELRVAGGSLLAMLVTEPSANNYPRLPIREGENAFVWFAGFADRSDGAHCIDTLSGTEPPKELARRLKNRPQLLKLAPTSRSGLRASPMPSARRGL